MKHESNHPDAMQQLWKAQPNLPVEVDMNRIQSDAADLEKMLRARDRRERFVAWPLAALFAVMSMWAFVSGNILSSVGASIVAGSMLWILYVLRRFGARSDHEAELGRDGRSFLVEYRGELIRQRRLLSFAWLWYCLPTLVGLALFQFGLAAEQGQALGQWALSVTIVVTVGVFVAVAVLNLVAARGLARRLDELGPVASED